MGTDGELAEGARTVHWAHEQAITGGNEPSAGPVIWLTGLSGAGKSTVAEELVHRLRTRDEHPVLLDGDQLREVMGVNAAYDAGSRRELALTYARMCRLFSQQGHTVVCATISLYHEVHRWNRTHIAPYIEVLLEVPLQELQRRDPKGVYGRATPPDQVMGVGLAAEFPVRPDLVIRNSETATTPAEAAEEIMRFCDTKGRS